LPSLLLSLLPQPLPLLLPLTSLLDGIALQGRPHPRALVHPCPRLPLPLPSTKTAIASIDKDRSHRQQRLPPQLRTVDDDNPHRKIAFVGYTSTGFPLELQLRCCGHDCAKFFQIRWA
jgi:hypothetical protein